MVSVNCQVPFVVMAVFVKMGCQKMGDDKFEAAQIRVVVLGSPTKPSMILPLEFRATWLTKGVTTLSEASLLVALP